MRRLADVVSVTAGLVLVGAVGACGVSPGDGGGSGSGSDASVDAPIDARGPIWIDAPTGGGTTDCKPPVTTYGDGQHNTGRDCLESCHNHGFTLAGTLYTSPSSNTGYAGATITIRDANNATFDLVVQRNGNFWTSQPIAFPAIVMASSCPYSAKMVAPIANGRCNTAACHAQQNGAAGQIHLP